MSVCYVGHQRSKTFGREVSSLESRQERFGSASASQPAGASERRQEQHMSKQSFAELGVSRAVCDALARRGIKAPFPVQRLVLEDALAGRDVLVKSPTGSGKTLAFAHPLGRAPQAERRDAGRARSRAHAGACPPDPGGAERPCRCEGSEGRRRLRRRGPGPPGEAGGAGARAGGHAGPTRGPARTARVHARSDPDPRARRGGPDARHGVPPRDRQDRRRLFLRAPDDVLLGHPRGHRRGPGRTLHRRSEDPRARHTGTV